MLRTNRRLISHLQHYYCNGLSPFTQSFTYNPLRSSLIYQHSHVCQKEDSVVNELLDVLNLRGKQLSWECLKTPDKSIIKELSPNTNVQVQTNSKFISILENNNSKTKSVSKSPKKSIESQSQRKQTIELTNTFSDLTKYCDKLRSTSISEAIEDESCPNIKQKRFNNNLRVYVDVCSRSSDTINYAFDMIERCIRPVESCPVAGSEPNIAITNNKPKAEDTTQYLTDVEVFNRLLFVLAEQGNVEKIIWCFNKMCEGNIKPNLDSYVASIEALGWHYDSGTKRGSCKIYTRQKAMKLVMDSKKFNLNLLDIATSEKYSSEQMKRIKRGMILAYPDFEFVRSEELSYLSPLISSLKTDVSNQNLQGIERSSTNKSLQNPDLLDKSIMIEHFKEQIRQEEQLMVEVPSIYSNKNSKKFEHFKGFLMKKFKDRITTNFNKCLNKLSQSKSNSTLKL